MPCERLLSTPDRSAYWALNSGVFCRWRAAWIASWWAWGRTVSCRGGVFRRGAHLTGGADATGGPVKADAHNRIAGHIPARRPFDTGMPASITASATFGHSASPDNVTCWHIMALQLAVKVCVKYFDNFSSPQPIAF